MFILLIPYGENKLSNVYVVVWGWVKSEISSLPVAVRVSETLLLKLPITRAMREQPKRLSRIIWEKWRERHFICFGFVSYRRCFLHYQPPFCAVGHFVCFSACLAVHYFAVYSVFKENMNKIMQITAFKAILAWRINTRECEDYKNTFAGIWVWLQIWGLLKRFKVLKKCRNKFDCLVYEMLFVATAAWQL